MTDRIAMDMTDERKKRFQRVTGLVVDLLREELPNPVEASAVLQFIIDGFRQTYGIQAVVILKDETEMEQ